MKPFDFVQFRIPEGKVRDILFTTDEIIKNKLFMSALNDASPDTFNSITLNKFDSSAEKTLYKYYSRWCTRCTPFGKFAGVFIAELNNDVTELFPQSPTIIVEPDIYVKRDITQYLNKFELRNSIFHINTSLYTVGQTYHYFQYVKDRYIQFRVQRSDILDTIIANARCHEISYIDIVKILSRNGVSDHEAEDIITELVEEQILISEYEFQLSETFNEYTIRQSKLSANTLSYIKNEFYLKNGRSTYSFITYQTGKIPQKAINDIIIDIKKLSPLFQKKRNFRMEQFCKQFLKRYDDREVSLPQLLDTELGIAYGNYRITPGSEILKKMQSESKAEKRCFGISEWNKTLLRKYLAYVKSGVSQIDLTINDLNGSVPDENLTFYIFGSILADSIQSLNQGDFLFLLKNVGGSSAVNLMSRFSLGNVELTEKLRSITNYEQSTTDALLAEVIHHPGSKAGNVVLHAHLRNYEISYLGNTGNIPLDDLMVSVRGKEVILRSKKFNKRVIPFLSHAYNYELGLPIYCFLGDLQLAATQLYFDWSFLEDNDYLPRVTFDRIILSRATWNLTENNYRKFERSLPQHVVIVEADNELYLDLKQPLCCQILQDYIRKNDRVKICEFLNIPDNCFINGHSSEIVIPVMGETNISSAIPLVTNREKTYPPGSEWLYLKLYMSPSAADKILRQKIRLFVSLLKKKHLIEKWFFIRYTDPEFHIRLRFFNGSNPGFYMDVLNFFHEYFQDEMKIGYIHELQIAEYKPEYARYGDIEQVEYLFMKDSEYSLAVAEDEYSRIQHSILQIHDWLSDMVIEKKINFCLEQRDAFLIEFGKEQKKNLNREYRIQASQIDNVLSIGAKGNSLFSFTDSQRASIIHMHVNRCFVSEPRKYEMLLYHFLFRYYTSLKAKR